MPYLILNVHIVDTWSNFSKMKLIGDAHNAKIWFTITAKTMVVVSGALLHLLIQEIFVPNSKNQSRDILDIIYDNLGLIITSTILNYSPSCGP